MAACRYVIFGAPPPCRIHRSVCVSEPPLSVILEPNSTCDPWKYIRPADFAPWIGASSYTFAEATWTQSLSDWISATSHIVPFGKTLGLVPRCGRPAGRGLPGVFASRRAQEPSCLSPSPTPPSSRTRGFWLDPGSNSLAALAARGRERQPTHSAPANRSARRRPGCAAEPPPLRGRTHSERKPAPRRPSFPFPARRHLRQLGRHQAACGRIPRRNRRDGVSREEIPGHDIWRVVSPIDVDKHIPARSIALFDHMRASRGSGGA